METATPAGNPLDSGTRGQHVMRLRTLLDLLADLPQPPKPGLLRGQDIPPRQYRFPRPLTPEDDARLQQHWAEATDTFHCALLLQRLTGMRIGECVDLAPDCLRHLGDNRWTLHVPHGKPRSERWVPVDDRVRVVIERLTFLRTLPRLADPRFLCRGPLAAEHYSARCAIPCKTTPGTSESRHTLFPNSFVTMPCPGLCRVLACEPRLMGI